MADGEAAVGGDGSDGVVVVNGPARVGVVMGSWSDWETMRGACEALELFGVGYERRVVSAHRTPDLLMSYGGGAAGRGLGVLIAGAGGAAHLPGMLASKTELPVIGVPVKSSALGGLDSLLSIVQMPRGVPVGTVAIGSSGAWNAGMLAAQVLGVGDAALRERVRLWRSSQAARVLGNPDPASAPDD